jgi:hypothetical protein
MAISFSLAIRSSSPFVRSISCWMPALLTRMFKSLKFSLTQLKRALRSSSLEMSQTLNCISGCFACTSRSLDSLLPQIMTLFPAAKKDSVRASPIPVAPPVIRVYCRNQYKFAYCARESHFSLAVQVEDQIFECHALCNMPCCRDCGKFYLPA